MKLVAALLLCVSINSLDDTLEDFRKHYGLSFYHHCKDYIRIFKCLTACKSIGFQVFRMDKSCKCTCHVMKTTTPVPFFMWRTNGTTRDLPRTFSPQLYHVVGTLSPATYSGEELDVTEVENVTDNGCPRLSEATTADGNSTADENATTVADGGDGVTTGAGGEEGDTADATTLPAEDPPAR